MKKSKHWANHQSLLRAVLAKISHYQVVGKDLQELSQNCFLNSVEFCELSSLKVFYGRTSQEFCVQMEGKTSRKLSENLQSWGMWEVGEPAQGMQRSQEKELSVWVLTGKLLLKRSPGETLSDILGMNSSIIYRGAGKDREYFERAPTLRSLSSTGKKQAGSGALKICISGNGTTGRQLRPIRPSEAERIMGFPAGWTALGRSQDNKKTEISTTQSIKMLGNSVIPSEISKIMEGLKEVLADDQQ